MPDYHVEYPISSFSYVNGTYQPKFRLNLLQILRVNTFKMAWNLPGLHSIKKYSWLSRSNAPSTVIDWPSYHLPTVNKSFLEEALCCCFICFCLHHTHCLHLWMSLITFTLYTCGTRIFVTIKRTEEWYIIDIYWPCWWQDRRTYISSQANSDQSSLRKRKE